MNQDDIERLLRKAPPLTPPDGLLARLQLDISLPRHRPQPEHRASALPWHKRWMPALSFSALMLGCFVIIAMQADSISKLRKENRTLVDETSATKTTQPPIEKVDRIKFERQELERLRKENAELQNLRTEAAQLQQQIAGLIQLRVVNQELRTGLAAAQPFSDDEAMAKAREKADSVRCANNLKNIGLAAHIYARDNEDTFPTDFLAMRNELSTPKILHCPSDLGKSEIVNWSEFSPALNSYEMLLSGLREADMEISTVVFKCPIHGHVCLTDGSVWQDPEKNGAKIVVKNGRQVLVPPSQPSPKVGVTQ